MRSKAPRPSQIAGREVNPARGHRRVAYTRRRGAWRSLVARLLWEQEVLGSNPGAPIDRRQSATTASISTGMPNGSSAAPIAERA
jgi:hypothetical protein